MNWYVIQSRRKQEERAEDNLRAWQVDTLLPKLRRAARSCSAAGTRVEPLFPGYLFARFDAEAMLGKIRYTRGVTNVLGTSTGPTPVDEAVIEAIRSRMDGCGLVRPTSLLRAGDRVRITAGPFREFLGVFEYATTATERVTLLLSTLQAQVRVTLAAHLIESAS